MNEETTEREILRVVSRIHITFGEKYSNVSIVLSFKTRQKYTNVAKMHY